MAWRRGGCGYPSRSSAVSAVDFVADPVPARVFKLISPAVATNRDEWRMLFLLRLLLLEQQSQALLGERPEGGVFLAGNTLHAFKQIIVDFNGRLHDTVTNIRTDGGHSNRLRAETKLRLAFFS